MCRVEFYKMNGMVSEQRLKSRCEAVVYILGKVLAHHCMIDLFLAGEREVNDGGNEGGLERRNDGTKVFIGVEGG